MGASVNARAVALLGYLSRVHPEHAGNEETICAMFGFTPAAFRAAED